MFRLKSEKERLEGTVIKQAAGLGRIKKKRFRVAVGSEKETSFC